MSSSSIGSSSDFSNLNRDSSVDSLHQDQGATIRFGRAVTVATETEPVSRVASAGRALLGTIGALPTLIPGLISAGYNKATGKGFTKHVPQPLKYVCRQAKAIWTGTLESKHLTDATPEAAKQQFGYDPSQSTELKEHLGFNPRNSQSIQAYLEREDIKPKIKEANGHLYLPIQGRKDASAFIFVPYKDMTQAMSVKVSKAHNGKMLASQEELTRAARSYSTLYGQVETEWKSTISDKLTSGSLVRKEQLSAFPKTLVIDASMHSVRIYKNDRAKGALANDSFMNKGYSSFFTGISVKIESDAWGPVDAIYNKQKTNEAKRGDGEDAYPNLLNGNRPPVKQPLSLNGGANNHLLNQGSPPTGQPQLAHNGHHYHR